jgi:hypothetical protein
VKRREQENDDTGGDHAGPKKVSQEDLGDAQYNQNHAQDYRYDWDGVARLSFRDVAGENTE